MTMTPVLPPWLIASAAAALGGVAVWRLVRAGAGGERAAWVMRICMVALLVVIALRPGIPGEATGPVATGGLEVYFVVDTTSSMSAEDVGGTAAGELPATRLDGVREDIRSIADALPGAQFSLTTFDATTVQRVPLTTDASALASAVQVLTPEVTFYSRGSSIDAPVEFMGELLDQARADDPDPRRVLFYLGDGEQTRDEAPGSFEPLAALVDGGGVLGYGTAEGGRMRVYDGFPADDESEARYIQDPSTGSDAISAIDDDNLTAVAGQLRVTYLRSGDGTAAALASRVDLGETALMPGTTNGPVEFYWIFAIPLALLALGEAVAAGLAIARTRPGGRRRP